jgi:predicted Zn-dependent peptidase
MRLPAILLLLAACAPAQIRTIAMPGKSPLVTFRIVFTTGSAADPAEKQGLAYLTAQMLADGGTKDLTYKQVTDALFPMASGVSTQVDKEMVTFSGATHVDNLAGYYKILKGMLLDPGWREEDFRRVKDDAINALKVGLREHLRRHAVRALQRRDDRVARKDHAGGCEGVLSCAVHAGSFDHGDRGRLSAGIPQHDEK